MRKQLRLITGLRMAVDGWSKETYPLPEMPNFANSRHLRRRVKNSYGGTGVIDLDIGWYVLCYPNGRRILSVLPF